MFFDDLTQINDLIENAGFSILVIPKNQMIFTEPGKKSIKTTEIKQIALPKNTIFIEPDEKGKIGIEKVREIEELMQKREAKPKFIVIKNAELLNIAAENAALKILEEPKENYHLVFFTSSLNYFLPTILSRASIYVYKESSPLEKAPAVDDEIKNLAKRIITAKQGDLSTLIDKLTDKKRKNPRQDILEVLETSIELVYKSYFKTGNTNLLTKLPNLIETYENIKANGHIKLQLWSHLC